MFRFVSEYWIYARFYMRRKHRTWSSSNCQTRENSLYVTILAGLFSLSFNSDMQGKIIMRWEYPGEQPPTWKAPPPVVTAPMAPPPLKLKIKLKPLTGDL